MDEEINPQNFFSQIGKKPVPQKSQLEFKMKTKKQRIGGVPESKKADRIYQLLSKQQKPISSQPPTPQAQLELDSRQSLGKLVTYYTQKGMHTELQRILEEHIEFCKHIQSVIQKQK